MFITSIITIEIPRRQQPYNPHINQYNTHELTRSNNLILMMQRPNRFWTSTQPQTWLSQISLQPFTPMPYTKHEHGISWNNPSKLNQGFQRPNHLNYQTMIPPHDQTSQIITRSISTPVVQGSKVFFPMRHPRLVTQPTAISELPTCFSNQGFQDQQLNPNCR